MWNPAVGENPSACTTCRCGGAHPVVLLQGAIIVEFIATLLFLYVTVLMLIGNKSEIDATKGGNDCIGVGILGIAWDFGGMIFMIVYCTAGGHINPTVTFWLFLARKVSLIRAILYIAAQCLGTICCCCLVKLFQWACYNLYGRGTNELKLGYSKGTGLAAELIGALAWLQLGYSKGTGLAPKNIPT